MIAGLITFAALGSVFGAIAGGVLRGRHGAILGLGLAVMLCLLGVVMFVGAVQCFGDATGLVGAVCSGALGAFSVLTIVTVGFPVAGLAAIAVFALILRRQA